MSALETVFGGIEFVGTDGPPVEVTDAIRASGGQFVEAAITTDDNGILGTQFAKHMRQQISRVGGEHTHQLALRPRRIRQGAENIEDGSHCHLAARAYGVLHRRVQPGCEEEANGNLVNALPYLRRSQVEINPQLSANIGAAALAAGGTVPVLGDTHSGSCCDEGHRGTDVECAGFVAACTTGIEQLTAADRKSVV